jgi:hypothetical protein
VVVNAMRHVQTLRERLVGNIVRRAFEYWCNAEKELSERVESALAPDRYAPLT